MYTLVLQYLRTYSTLLLLVITSPRTISFITRRAVAQVFNRSHRRRRRLFVCTSTTSSSDQFEVGGQWRRCVHRVYIVQMYLLASTSNTRHYLMSLHKCGVWDVIGCVAASRLCCLSSKVSCVSCPFGSQIKVVARLNVFLLRDMRACFQSLSAQYHCIRCVV